MAEIRTLIDGQEIGYDGILDVRNLILHIDNYFREKGYKKIEAKNYEEIYEDGKQIVLEILPYKEITDYAKYQIRIFMVFSKLTDVLVEINGAKRELQKGRAQFSFDAYLITDYENKFERTPFFYFFRTIADKFFGRNSLDRVEADLKNDCYAVQNEIRGHLNMLQAQAK